MLEPIAVLTFTVRDPVSVNRAYSPRKGKGRGLMLNPVVRRFKELVALSALNARASRPAVGDFWPSNPWRVKKARLSYQLYTYRGDVDGPRKGVRDALEGILYVNDKHVSDGACELPLPIGDKRIEITVELLEVISEVEAKELQRTTEAAQAKRRAAAVRKKSREMTSAGRMMLNRNDDSGREPYFIAKDPPKDLNTTD